jgi:tetratricopeptide (TPR) repeat protein
VLKPVAGNGSGVFSSTGLRVPGAARRLFIQALEQIGEKDYNTAIASLDKATIKYPKYAAAYQLKGQVLERTGKRELARAAYQSAASADPAYTKPLIQLAELAAEDQNPGQAGRWAGMVNKLAPGAYPDTYLIEGAAYYNLDRLDESERAARPGIDAVHGNSLPRLHKLLGEVLYRKYDYSGALAQFEEYLSTAAKARTRLSASQGGIVQEAGADSAALDRSSDRQGGKALYFDGSRQFYGKHCRHVIVK